MAMSKILIVGDDATFVRLLSEEHANYNQFKVRTAMKKGDDLFVLKKEAVDLDAGNYRRV